MSPGHPLRTALMAVACSAPVALTACGAGPPTGSSSAGASSLPPSAASTYPTLNSTSACRARGSGLYVLPDPRCTPGALNPAVNQGNIASTICRSGYTSSIRPPASYTDALKRRGLTAYGDTGSIHSYEEDHLISLELGGSPTSPLNLWPEPGASPNPKDAVEDAAHSAVCSGRIPLSRAQQEIATDWISFGRQLGVIAPS